MATQNPFDFSAMFQQFDPQAVMQEMQKNFGEAFQPKVDTQALVDSQRKNVELLMATNKAVIESAQAVMQRQSEMVQKAVEEATEAAQSLAGSGNPQEISAKQVELVQAAYEKALANSNEISDMVKKTQDEVAAKVNTRVNESLEELKATIAKLK